jgi:integrase/recombinase XerC
MPNNAAMQEFLIPAKPDLQAARQSWLKIAWRASGACRPATVDAYERDTRQFLHFLTGHNAAARPA